jgi:hypothetical protein
MSNEAIREAMSSMYAVVLQKHAGTNSDPMALLLRVLPSVIYHSDWIMDQVRENPGHPFSAIPLLNNEALLARLKPLVTTDPGGQILKATGVPPTIEIAQNSKKVLALCIETLEGVQAMGETIKDAVFQAFELRAIENGQMTTQQMKDMLLQSQEEMQTFMTQQIATLRNAVALVPAEVAVSDDDDGDAVFADGMDDEEVGEAVGGGHRLYTHGGRMWQTPKDFEFPKESRPFSNGWTLWLVGLPGYEVVAGDGTTRKAPV